MKWTIQFDNSGNFVKITCEGQFKVEDSNSLKGELISNPKWQPGMNILLDHRQTGFSGVSADTLRGLGRQASISNSAFGKGKIAFLMKEERDFGLEPQYELINEDYMCQKMMVFHQEQPAFDRLCEPQAPRTLTSSSSIKPKPL